MRQKYVQRQPWVIAAVLVWAARPARPVCWACDPAHWHTARLRPVRLPSASTTRRRATGHHDQSPARRRGIGLWRTAFGQAVSRCRVGIEGAFGNATSVAGGMGPLPAWVRRLGRVQRWVWAKWVINAARIRFRAAQRQRLPARLQ